MPFTRIQIATAIAIIFHLVGLVGMLWFKSDLIVQSTPLHLLLMAVLIFYTQKGINKAFLFFFVVCVIAGFFVEYLGVHTGLIFGDYRYGTVLGPTWQGIPLIIGVNWFIIMYICGVSLHLLLTKLKTRAGADFVQPSRIVGIVSLLFDGATLAVFLDWLMEPVAVKLGYWTWLGSGDIPILNYISWFVVSVVFLLLFHLLPFNKGNKFAVNLLLIQAMFFLLLRTFL
jgi:putative membrane protein